MSSLPPPQWLPDPFQRYEHRFWDGGRWTEHVGSNGVQAIDPPLPAPPTKDAPSSANRAPALFREPVLIVNQKGKLFERHAEYSVEAPDGRFLGAVVEGRRHLMETISVPGSTRAHRFEILDEGRRPLMSLVQPATLMRPQFTVRGADGSEVGEIVQKNMGVFRKVTFDLTVRGSRIGRIEGEDWRALDFSITDRSGVEIAHVSKKWGGFMKEMFTKGDKYAVEIRESAETAHRPVIVAASVAIDTALRQSDPRNKRR